MNVIDGMFDDVWFHRRIMVPPLVFGDSKMNRPSMKPGMLLSL